MSKIKINEIESLTSNGDLSITPSGTGVFEVAADNDDGTLQLNSASNNSSVKIKSPSSGAAQSYTMILPEDNITANQFLKVNSISGSGATAIGQLGYGTITGGDVTQLNGSDFTSGTVPTARLGDFGASAGGGLQLVQKQTASSTVSSITFSNIFEANKMYKIIGKKIFMGSSTYPNVDWLDASGNSQSNIKQTYWPGVGSTNSPPSNVTFTNSYMRLYAGSYTSQGFAFEIELSNKEEQVWMHYRGFGRAGDSRMEGYATFTVSSRRIYGLKFYPQTGNFATDTQILVYEYNEV